MCAGVCARAPRVITAGKFTMVREIEDLAAFEAALKEAGDRLVVVDFTATWCGPCRMIGPIFKALSEDPENKNVVFLKVDVDEAQDVAKQCEVNCMPTFHFYKNGEKIYFFSGADKDELGNKINQYK